MGIRLTEEQKNAIFTDIRTGGMTAAAMADKHQLSVSTIDRLKGIAKKTGRPKGKNVEVIWADIRKGMSGPDVVKKYGVSESTYYLYKKRLEKGMNGLAKPPVAGQLVNGEQSSGRTRIISAIVTMLDNEPRFFRRVVDLMIEPTDAG